ncbi:MAG: hypothetical protein V1746_01630 [bacterium]
MKPIFTRTFFLVLGLFIIGESAVRIFWARNMSGRFEYGYNSTAGFVEKANPNGGTIVRLVRAGGRRFHPQFFFMPKPADTFRVFTIGDSVPRGPSLDAAYPHRLEEMLRAKSIPTESLNLGVPGYGARRCQIVLKQVLNYQPDLIILHLNNSNEYEDEREYRRAREFASWHPKNWLMKSFLLRRLYELNTEKAFWELLPKEIREQAAASDADAEVAAMQNEAQRTVWKKRVEQTAHEDARLAREANVPLLVLTQAVVDAKSRVLSEDKDLTELAQALEKEGALSLSMKKIFGESDLSGDFADGAHLRASGHQKIAAALADLVMARRAAPAP